jgi:hypothetical protein
LPVSSLEMLIPESVSGEINSIDEVSPFVTISLPSFIFSPSVMIKEASFVS